MSYEVVYEENKLKVQQSIKDNIQNAIRNEWNMINEWLSFDDHDIVDIYIAAFKEHFEEYFNIDISNTIFVAAKHLGFMMGVLLEDKKITQTKLIKQVLSFIDSQFWDLENWCSEIKTQMYEESSEYAEENGISMEQDPN